MHILIPRSAWFTLWYLAVDLEMLWTLAGLHHGRLQMVSGHWSKLLAPSSDSHGQNKSSTTCKMYGFHQTMHEHVRLWKCRDMQNCSLNKNTFQVCHCCLPSDQHVDHVTSSCDKSPPGLWEAAFFWACNAGAKTASLDHIFPKGSLVDNYCVSPSISPNKTTVTRVVVSNMFVFEMFIPWGKWSHLMTAHIGEKPPIRSHWYLRNPLVVCEGEPWGDSSSS